MENNTSYIQLNDILFGENGDRLQFVYRGKGKAIKYINRENPLYTKYQIDIRHVPKSLLLIPFVANWLPIAWFGGFDIIVPEIDKAFYDSMELIKKSFQEQYPNYRLKGSLISKKLVSNELKGNKSVLLFSGGVDAYATFLRIADNTPDLVTIHGADIEISDLKQWDSFKEFVTSEPLLSGNKKLFIETNVRDFYTYHTELLLTDIGWWGKVQHGLSLIGSIAPLAYINGYSDVFIASSYTEEIQIAWGSTPTTDELIKWNSINVHHDGYELKRQDKVDLISKHFKSTDKEFNLRVCYSELRKGFNCNNCEKCFRTILGIILNGEDPNKFGFDVDESVYNRIFSQIGQSGASKGMKYFWWELMLKARQTTNPFIFKDPEMEIEYIRRIGAGELDALMKQNLELNKKSLRIKFILRNKFPAIWTLYRKLK